MLPGGCTRDLVHRFYQEKYQINGGKQNRYVTGSDAVGLTMGTYDTKQLPIYTVPPRHGAPNYVIADRFFQGAFGGSFFNHQWLIAGRAPVDTNDGPTVTLAPANSVAGRQRDARRALPAVHGRPAPSRSTASSPQPAPIRQRPNDTQACGNFAVNTVQPASAPFGARRAGIPLIDDT